LGRQKNEEREMEKQGYLITREMVYGTETPEIPHSFEDTGEFRAPLAGEVSLLDNGGGAWWHVCASKRTEPRIILRKKRVRKVVFTQVGERKGMPGDWVELEKGTIRQLKDESTLYSYPIFTREEVFE
jgi:hypothetical protein